MSERVGATALVYFDLFRRQIDVFGKYFHGDLLEERGVFGDVQLTYLVESLLIHVYRRCRDVPARLIVLLQLQESIDDATEESPQFKIIVRFIEELPQLDFIAECPNWVGDIVTLREGTTAQSIAINITVVAEHTNEISRTRLHPRFEFDNALRGEVFWLVIFLDTSSVLFGFTVSI